MLTGCFACSRCSGPGHGDARGAWFPGGPGRLPRRAVEWAGAVRADGEDEVGRDSGAGRVVVAARVAEHRAHRVGARRGRTGGLKAAARQRIAAGQLELDLGLQAAGPSGPLPVTSSRMGHLLDALDRGYRVLGLDKAAAGTRCSGCWWRQGSSSW